MLTGPTRNCLHDLAQLVKSAYEQLYSHGSNRRPEVPAHAISTPLKVSRRCLSVLVRYPALKTWVEGLRCRLILLHFNS